VFTIIIKIVLLAFICIMSGCGQHTDFTEETLILRLNSDNGITTENEYSGWVTITVSGTGHISDTLQTDALYLIGENNQPIEGDTTTRWGILIDTYSLCCEVYQHPPFAWATNAYNLENRYSFEYYIGTSSRQITFSSGDDTTSDNYGELVVDVTTKPLFSGR
jgi:hypothetical protein